MAVAGDPCSGAQGSYAGSPFSDKTSPSADGVRDMIMIHVQIVRQLGPAQPVVRRSAIHAGATQAGPLPLQAPLSPAAARPSAPLQSGEQRQWSSSKRTQRTPNRQRPEDFRSAMESFGGQATKGTMTAGQRGQLAAKKVS